MQFMFLFYVFIICIQIQIYFWRLHVDEGFSERGKDSEGEGREGAIERERGKG